MDGSSFISQGQRKASYAVVSTSEIIEAKPLPLSTSAQKAEPIALTRVLLLAKDLRVVIYADSKCARHILHAQAAVWLEGVSSELRQPH